MTVKKNNAVTSKYKPDFLIIGSMKSGTTSLHSDLTKFSDVYLPEDKEPAFLTKCISINKIKNEYERYFNGSNGRLCGEGSTDYTKLPKYECVVQNAKELCGDALKLIIVVRDPIERIYSHLKHDIAAGSIDVHDINRVVIDDPQYITISDYGYQLRPWVKAFGVENVLCVSFIEYKENRVRILTDVARFLGVKYDIGYFQDAPPVKNKSTELKRTGKFLSLFLRTNLYRYYIRNLMSSRLIDALRSAFLADISVPNVSLSEEVELELKKRLSHVEGDLESLFGYKIKVNSNVYS